MCKCKKIDLSELMDSNYIRTPCKSVNCCISKSKTICKKVDECITNSSSICKKVDECIIARDDEKCKNPLFTFECIPFPANTNPVFKEVINAFGKKIQDTLRGYGVALFTAIETGDYSGLIIPSDMKLSIYGSDLELLYSNGVPEDIPSTAITTITKPLGIYLLANTFSNTASLSLTSENITMDNLFKGSDKYSVIVGDSAGFTSSSPATYTVQTPSGDSTSIVGNIYIWILKL